jgi:hypothetical protein
MGVARGIEVSAPGVLVAADMQNDWTRHEAYPPLPAGISPTSGEIDS